MMFVLIILISAFFCGILFWLSPAFMARYLMQTNKTYRKH